MITRIFDFFSSLKLTVVCLSAALVLVFVGTIAQKDLGLYEAQHRFFHSFFIHATVPGLSLRVPIFPGGYLVGWVLIVNLVAAHIRRFQFNVKHLGTFMTHFGVILLLGGQFITDTFQVESHMRLSEGEPLNYSVSDREVELVVIDTSNPGYDDVTSIPVAKLATGKEIRNAKLPFSILVKKFLPNSRLANRAPMVDKEPPAATQGFGTSLILTEAPMAIKMDDRNLPSAVLELNSPQGPLGTWLVSVMLEEKQSLSVGSKSYQLALRFARYYQPFSLELIKFRHDKYQGTEIPKNFSSQIVVHNPATQEKREVLIYMNNPLRYGGKTFYQASYDEKNPRVTILQVVRNPGWLTPYVSCTLVGVGLLVQFMTHLIGFINKPKTV